MKTKLQFKFLLVAFIVATFMTQLMAQKLNTDIAFANNSVILNQTAYFNDFEKYLRDHLKYPKMAQDYNVEGVVQTEVEISPTGEMVSAKITCGLGFGCDEAILNLLYNMPRWNPTLKNGTPRAQKLSIPVKFSLR